MKQKISPHNIALGGASILLAAAFALYDIVLQIVSPGNLFSTIFAFSNLWLIPAAYFGWAGAWRLRRGRSVWASAARGVRQTARALVTLGAVVAVSCLAFILTPRVASADVHETNVKQIILLGGGIDKDGALLPPVMQRVEAAARFYSALAEKPLIVVTGGTLAFKEFAEAPEIMRQLIRRGVSAERILVEDRARDTIENFRNAVMLLRETLGTDTADILSRPTAVVTNRFHLHRAELLAMRMGFADVTGIAASDEPLFIPNNYAREILACVKLVLRIALTGKPTRLDGADA